MTKPRQRCNQFDRINVQISHGCQFCRAVHVIQTITLVCAIFCLFASAHVLCLRCFDVSTEPMDSRLGWPYVGCFVFFLLLHSISISTTSKSRRVGKRDMALVPNTTSIRCVCGFFFLHHHGTIAFCRLLTPSP